MHTSLYRNILSKYISKRSTIAELGAGYGLKIFSIAKSKRFSTNGSFAEFTKAVKKLCLLLKESINNKVKIGFNDLEIVLYKIWFQKLNYI